jgi:uncharacterized protein with von Willebrand factor type A (vWA) domain
MGIPANPLASSPSGHLSDCENVVMETERCQGIALAFDASMDLVMKDMWELAKGVLTLSYDALLTGIRTPTVITYSEKARFIDPNDISDMHYEYVYGTNLQAALRTAQQVLNGLDEKGRILVIGYAEPSAHSNNSDDVFFMYPPIPKTARLTMEEARNCARAGIRVDVLLLSADSPLHSLGIQIAAEGRGVCKSLTTEMPIDRQLLSFFTDVGLM